jgi:uncharacterized FlaG/YvyC family protein
MASDGQPVKISATSLVHGSQAPTTVTVQRSGKTLPPSGKAAAEPAALRPTAAEKAGTAAGSTDLQNQVSFLNKFLNDSGKPDQFRVDPTSDGKLIQQINPATGQVVGEFPASEFAELARSVGLSGVLVNSRV